jgi:hypothetical protein
LGLYVRYYSSTSFYEPSTVLLMIIASYIQELTVTLVMDQCERYMGKRDELSGERNLRILLCHFSTECRIPDSNVVQYSTFYSTKCYYY